MQNEPIWVLKKGKLRDLLELQGAELPILLWLAENADREGMVEVALRRKRQMAHDMKLNEKSISNRLSEMNKKGFLVRKDRAYYQLNLDQWELK